MIDERIKDNYKIYLLSMYGPRRGGARIMG
jgi:hypothetical protein